MLLRRKTHERIFNDSLLLKCWQNKLSTYLALDALISPKINVATNIMKPSEGNHLLTIIYM